MARPKIRVRFKYNIDTGEIEEFFVDDNQPSASEAAHDQRARAVASRLARAPDIRDAGPVRIAETEIHAPPSRSESQKDDATQTSKE